MSIRISVTADGGVEKEVLDEGQGQVVPLHSRCLGTLVACYAPLKRLLCCKILRTSGSERFKSRGQRNRQVIKMDLCVCSTLHWTFGRDWSCLYGHKIREWQWRACASGSRQRYNSVTAPLLSADATWLAYILTVSLQLLVDSALQQTGLNLGVASMKQGERCRLYVSAKYGYGAKGMPQLTQLCTHSPMRSTHLRLKSSTPSLWLL